jgi:Carboxypeptidase regulatory-like domain
LKLAIRKVAMSVLAFAVLAVPGVRVRAQGEARLAGVVRTGQGIPVPAATVRAENVSTHSAWMSWTDSAGQFVFPGLPTGHYQLEVTMLGFSPTTRTVDLSGPVTLDVSLSVATLAEIEPRPPASQPEARAGGRGGRGPESAGGRGSAEASRAGGFSGGRGRLSASEMSAIQSEMGGFQQVDVTGEANATEMGQSQVATQQVPGQVSSQAVGGAQPGAAFSTASLGAASSSDSFLMNGSVGQSVDTLPGAGMAMGGRGFGPGGGMLGGVGEMVGGGPGGMPGGGPGGPVGGGGRGGFGARGGFGGRGPGGFRGGRGPATTSVAALYARRRFARSSVNRVRFNVTDTYANSIWDARPYSLTQANPPKLSHYNERLGVSLGGPLYIPHIYDGRNRTFVFANYNLSHAQNAVDNFSTVPTLPERSGNFCDRNVELFNPYSSLSGPRTPLDPNNPNDPNSCQVPSNMIDSAAQGLMKYIPPPNLSGLVQNFHLQGTVPRTSNFVNVHVLHSISSRLSVNGGYNFQSSHADTLTNFPLLAGSSSTRNQNVQLSLIQTFSPRLTQNTSLNFNRSRVQSLSANSYLTDIAASLGITGVSSAPIDFGVPQIGFTTFTGLNDPLPSLNRNQTWRIDDGLTYTLARHTLTGGFEARRIDWNRLGDTTPRGSFTFTGLMTSQLGSTGLPTSGTGLDFADFLLGLPQSTSFRYGTYGPSASYFRSWGYAAYFQDDWRIDPRFSLSYGVRYDFVTPPTELFNHIANLALAPDYTQLVVVTPGSPAASSAGLPRALLNSSPNNWQPRIGFAWQPFHNDPTIIRGGYSMFYNESIYQQLAFEMANQPPFALAESNLTSPTSLLTLQNGFPSGAANVAQNTYAVDPNYHVGYAQIWDLSIERGLGGGAWVLSAFYTGTKGTHLDMQLAPHSVPPGSPLAGSGGSSFIYDTSAANSIYNAAHLTIRKRPTHGLMIMGDYAFGKSIDDASTIGGGATTVVQNDANFRAERGLSSFDIRQQFRSLFFYQLPFGTTQRWARGGWSERLFGNYRLNGVLTMNSGTPFTAHILGVATNNTATGASFPLRADQVASGCGGPGTLLEFFNTAAFVVPPAGQYGDAGRNTICGPSLFNLNLGLDRNFIFGSDRTRQLDVRWEVNNLTNTAHYTGLDTVVNSASYGRVTSAGSMRSMDITMRLSF